MFQPLSLPFVIQKASPSSELMDAFTVQPPAQSLPGSQPGELPRTVLQLFWIDNSVIFAKLPISSSILDSHWRHDKVAVKKI